MNTRQSDIQQIPAFLRTALLVLIFAMFFVLVISRIGDIDPDWDEAENLHFAVTLLHGHNPFQPNPLFFMPSVALPPMTCFYTGSFVLFLKIPFLFFMGASILSMRIGFVLLAAFGMVGCYCCVRYFFSDLAALIAVLLMATNTIFIRAARLGSEHEEITALSLFWIGAALLCAFAKHKKTIYAGLAGFFWGVAIYAKLLSGIYFLGLAVLFVLFRKKIIMELKPEKKHLVFFGLMFCVGALPFINYVIIYWDTIINFQKASDTLNIGLIEKIGLRFMHIVSFIKQANCTDIVSHNKGFFPVLAPLTVIVSTVWALGPWHFFPQHKKTAVLSLLILPAVTFCGLLLVPGTPKESHMLGLIPFMEILCAAVFYAAFAAEKTRDRVIMLAIMVPAVCYTLFNGAQIMNKYFEHIMYYPKHASREQYILAYAQKNNCTPLYMGYSVMSPVFIQHLYPGRSAKLSELPQGKTDIYVVLDDLADATKNPGNWKYLEQKHNIKIKKIKTFHYKIATDYTIYKISINDNISMQALMGGFCNFNHLYIEPPKRKKT